MSSELLGCWASACFLAGGLSGFLSRPASGLLDEGRLLDRFEASL
jgi:hypothetical protein